MDNSKSPATDPGSDVQTVVLTTDTGHTFTLRFTMRAAGRLFSEAHNTLNSVAVECNRSRQNRQSKRTGANRIGGRFLKLACILLTYKNTCTVYYGWAKM